MATHGIAGTRVIAVLAASEVTVCRCPTCDSCRRVVKETRRRALRYSDCQSQTEKDSTHVSATPAGCDGGYLGNPGQLEGWRG